CLRREESDLEADLFGRKGDGRAAPAHQDQASQFALARGGTLFLDDVDALSSGLQLKLLRVLREGTFEPIGSTQAVPADVRLVLGSCEDLDALVEQGQFRSDLYYW